MRDLDPAHLRREYGLPEAVSLRRIGADLIAALEGTQDAAGRVAAGASSLPVAPRKGRSSLRRVESALGPLLVREYRKGGALRALRGRRFRGRMRPLDELALSRRLVALRVPVVEAVGAVVNRSAWGWRGFLLTREVDGALDLETFLYAPAAHAEWPMAHALAAAGAAVRAMHDVGVRHGDLHLKNLLLDPAIAAARVLDFDRAASADGPLSDADRLVDLVRLARSVEKHRLRGLRVGRKSALRFLRAYGGGVEAGDRWLDLVRTRLRRGLAFHALWWRLSGQARPRVTAGGPPTAPRREGAPA